jgi:hypothetical protein
MSDRLRGWLGTLADVVTLLLVLPLVFTFLSDTFSGSGPFIKVAVSALGLIVIITLAGLVRDRYKKTVADLRDKQISIDVENMESQKGKPLKDMLPSEGLLRRWAKSLGERAKLWAGDVSEGDMNFYLYVGSESKAHMQAYYYSPWKKLRLVVYCGSFSAESMEEADGPLSGAGRPFYEFTNWRKAVLKAYEKISEQLPPAYKLILMSTTDCVNISFAYTQGKIDRTYHFQFDGYVLKGEADGSEVKI